MSASLAKVKALVLDVDGVLTDGRIFCTASGESARIFYVPDGIGIRMLKKAGIRCAAITGSSSDSVRRRLEHLKFDAIIADCVDKGPALDKLAADWQLGCEQVAYMGDDLVDIAPMVAAGVAAAPAGAHPAVLAAAALVTRAGGGAGAVRELCEMILSAQESQVLKEAKECGLRL